MFLGKLRKSFTLIEMLIVIVIIGILAAAIIPRLQSVQERARDTQRKADLKTIYSALEIYFLDYTQYPQPRNSVRTCQYNANCRLRSNDTGYAWIHYLTGIITTVPVDPINQKNSPTSPQGGPWSPGNFIYSYGIVINMLSGANSYDLTAQLENKNDPDRCQIRKYQWQYPPVPFCNNPSANQVYELSPDSNSF